MKKLWSHLTVMTYLLIATVYFVSLGVSLYVLAVNLYTGKDIVVQNHFLALSFFGWILTQLVWGIVEGTFSHFRGWRSTGQGHFTNWLGNVLIAGLFATPGLMVMAGIERWRTGKFFPAPQESSF